MSAEGKKSEKLQLHVWVVRQKGQLLCLYLVSPLDG